MGSLLRGWQRHCWADWRLAVEALWWLSLVRMTLWILPIRYVVRWMGLIQGGTEGTGSKVYQPGEKATRIGWAVHAASARTPWRNTCLIQALAGAHMLSRRSLPAVLYLGAAHDRSHGDKLEAHAWLSCGDAILIGQGDKDRFTVVATFINKWLLL